MSGGDHLQFELQPKPKGRKTEIWTVVDQSEYRLGEVRWWASWRRYTFHPDAGTLYDPECLRRIATFCDGQTKQRKEDRKKERTWKEVGLKGGEETVDKSLAPCMSYCKRETRHDGECAPMEGR